MRSPQLRVARPVGNLRQTAEMYCRGLGLEVLARFEDHDGFDGVMLGQTGSTYHFEFTACRHHQVVPSPTNEDLVVFYLPDPEEWLQTCVNMKIAGFEVAPSFNPYWDVRGRTFVDPDGYRTVIQNSAWH